ncbi:disease resistance RPM1-like [Olea europaea subsp. europaea]|uniref:Disease resistance RPM1-like n=1 Tax=Olea europaea subsp. europaea TaxID=158383 RepID=A0A8S0TNY8_OLEEU|nr:disease resistance RPM1-like [Olea europaea subsp. europaea]
MADVVISFAVQCIIPILQEKLREAGAVETDVDNIRDELNRMMAFLKDADSAVDNSDTGMINWVNQVRDVAQDTEDVLDKFVLGLKKNRQGSGWSNPVLPNFLNCIVNLRFFSRIVSEIQSINSRVISIAEGHRRYFDTAGSPNSNSNVDTSLDLAYDIRGDALLEEEVNLVGIEGPKSELTRLLWEKGSGLSVISVVGPGGVGKSALVRKVYDDAAVKKQFKSHAWITVPRLFEVQYILKDLIQQLFRETKEAFPEEMNTMNNIQLKELIRLFLREKRYVIVFDDVRGIELWKAIKRAFPDYSCGSRLIVTTRNTDVALYSAMRNKENVYTLKPLPPEHSLTLFCQKTFRGSPCPSHLEEITNNILKRCAGLPIAIKSVGGILASKSRRLDEWERVYKSLGAELERENRNLNMILLLSFNDLPYHLKYCLLYMAIYPEYHLIKCNSLIRLWIVEGFVNEEKEGWTVEQVAQDYLKELAKKNLIEVVKAKENGSIKSCRINYFLRENLLNKAKRQNFLMKVGKNSSGQWNSKARRLSIDGPWENFNPQISGKKLRSLLVFDVTDSSSILELLNSCMMLKVLDLSGLPLKSFPEVITKLLLLKYLSLRHTEIGSLPRSIKKLQELETLDLKHSLVTELPVEILELRKLRHLIICRYVCSAAHSDVQINVLGFKLPNGIGALKSLYQLSFVEAIPGTIIEIGNMKELRRLFIFKLGREDGMMVCSSIEKLQNLQSLALFSKAENEILDLDHISSPPASLQELSVSGRLEKFPYWIKSLNNLVKVYFRWSRLRDDPLQYLQDLPSLVRLELLDGYVGEELCFKAGKFQSLKRLCLDTFESLKQVIIEEGAMPKLKRIKIQRCQYLKSVPSGIECLDKMKVLKLYYMSPQFIEKLTVEDFPKIAHIPKVRFWKNDVTEMDED